jgi:hypothetical protein
MGAYGKVKPWRVSPIRARYNGEVVLPALAAGTAADAPSFDTWVRAQSNRSALRSFVRCDSHYGRGGPHLSRGVYVGEYHGATVWACTHRSKRGRVCGSLQLELEVKS